jgi:hypothetical protein
VDGYANKGNVRKAVVDAFGYNGIALERGQLKYSASKYVAVHEYRQKLVKLIERNGGDASMLALLIVGKSFGGAKMYRFSYKYADLLGKFAGVATVLVDPHEPIIPGDEGDTGKWYDYVYFKGGGHRLKWWHNKWGPHGNQTAAGAKRRFYVTYQRNEWPRGYGMATPYQQKNLTGKKVQPHGQSKKELATHWNIARCASTVALLQDAIGYLGEC